MIISITLAIAEDHFLCEYAVSAPNRKTRSDIKYISNVKMSLKQPREETQLYLVLKIVDTQEFYFTILQFFHTYGMESICILLPYYKYSPANNKAFYSTIGSKYFAGQ